MAKKLMSFRVAPDLANYLAKQSEVLGISVTEIVNRLLRWAVQNVPEGFFQTASLVSNTSIPIIPESNLTVAGGNPAISDDYAQFEKLITEMKEQLSNEMKEQLSNEMREQSNAMKKEFSKFREEHRANFNISDDTANQTERKLVGNGNGVN